MRFYIVYLENDEQIRYSLHATDAGVTEITDWQSLPTVHLVLQRYPSFNQLKLGILGLAEVGDYVLWWPNLPIRTATVISSLRQFRSAHNSRHEPAVRSLLRCPLYSRNPYSSFPDAAIGLDSVDDQDANFRTRLIDPWASLRRMGTTVQPFIMRGASPESSIGPQVIPDNGPMLGAIDPGVVQTRQRTYYVAQFGPPLIEVPQSYRQCRRGEVICFGYKVYHSTSNRWIPVTSAHIGQKVTNPRHTAAPDFPFPDWIRKHPKQLAYRYLELGEIIQTGDISILGDGTFRSVSELAKGTAVSGMVKDCFLRLIGQDGWKSLERAGEEEIASGVMEYTYYRMRETRLVHGQTVSEWTAMPFDHLVDHEFYEYRRLVPGYKMIWEPSNFTDPPLGYRWIPAGGYVCRGEHGSVTESGSVSQLGAPTDESWFFAPVDRLFVAPDPEWNWDACRIRASSYVPNVELLSYKCTSRVFDDGLYWVLNKHGLMAIQGMGATGYIRTQIGSFYPASFRIDGKVRLVFCTDQVSSNQLAVRLADALSITAGGMQGLMNITINPPYHQAEEVLDRQVEL